MKSTGIVRRIDELGRIVIPKEIRKNLGIREGENLEIFIEENKIVLQKQMVMDNAKQITEKLVNLVLDIYDINIIVTNRDSVVISTDSDIKVNEKISNKLVKIMESRQVYDSYQSENILITNTELNAYFYMVPIIVDADAIGLIVITNNLKISDEEKKIIKFLEKIINNSLSIS